MTTIDITMPRKIEPWHVCLQEAVCKITANCRAVKGSLTPRFQG